MSVLTLILYVHHHAKWLQRRIVLLEEEKGITIAKLLEYVEQNPAPPHADVGLWMRDVVFMRADKLQSLTSKMERLDARA